MPDPIEFVVIPFALAAGITLAVLIGALGLDRSRFRGRWAGPPAIAIGMLGPYRWITESLPAFPPRDARERWLYLLVVAGIVGAFLASKRPRLWIEAMIVLGVALLGFVLILWSPLQQSGESATVVMLLGLAGLAGLVWWWAMDPAMSELEPITSPLAMSVLAFGGAVLLMLSASAMYGRLAFAFSGAVSALCVVSALRGEFLARGCGIVLLAGLGGLLLAGNYYSIADERLMNLAILSTAPALMCLRRIAPMLRERGPRGAVVSLALLMIPIIVALVITVPRFLERASASANDLGY